MRLLLLPYATSCTLTLCTYRRKTVMGFIAEKPRFSDFEKIIAEKRNLSLKKFIAEKLWGPFFDKIRGRFRGTFHTKYTMYTCVFVYCVLYLTHTTQNKPNITHHVAEQIVGVYH